MSKFLAEHLDNSLIRIHKQLEFINSVYFHHGWLGKEIDEVVPELMSIEDILTNLSKRALKLLSNESTKPLELEGDPSGLYSG